MICNRTCQAALSVAAAAVLLANAGPCAEDCTTITSSAYITTSSWDETSGGSPPQTLVVGDTISLFFKTCTCVQCTGTSAGWQSTNPEVATVVAGEWGRATVTGRSVGTTTIQAESSQKIDGRLHSAAITVNVEDGAPLHATVR